MIIRKPDGYNELLVYKRAEELRLHILKLTEKLSYDEKRRKVHLNDSARSVKQNIVEGWKRVTTKEYYDFLSFSLGSLAEIKEDIKDLYEDKKISKEAFEFLTNKCQELDFLLNRLRRSLYLKMEKEGTLPLKEKYSKIKFEEKQDEKDFNKVLKNMGLVRLEDGQYVQKGEMGEKGEKGSQEENYNEDRNGKSINDN